MYGSRSGLRHPGRVHRGYRRSPASWRRLQTRLVAERRCSRTRVLVVRPPRRARRAHVSELFDVIAEGDIAKKSPASRLRNCVVDGADAVGAEHRCSRVSLDGVVEVRNRRPGPFKNRRAPRAEAFGRRTPPWQRHVASASMSIPTPSEGRLAPSPAQVTGTGAASRSPNPDRAPGGQPCLTVKRPPTGAVHYARVFSRNLVVRENTG